MKYLLLIHHAEPDADAVSPEVMKATVAEYGAVVAQMRAEGAYLDGQPLRPPHTATVLRKQGGRVTLTDGPFAEAREQLAGFFLVEARDREHACALAARIPAARFGSIEVRAEVDHG